MPNVIKIGGGVLGAVKKQIKDAKPLSKAEAKANKRGLKAANKPVSKNNRNVGGPTLKGIIKNAKPARPNRERGGSLSTLRKQGKTTGTSAASKASLTGKLSGLENRGARLTATQRKERALDYQWEKAEKAYDASSEMAYTGLRSYPKGFDKSRAQGVKGKKLSNREAVRKEATRKVVKINSQQNLKKKGK
jgi:hypothetical protein